MRYNNKKVEQGIILILEGMGIDWKNDVNFKGTPERIVRMMKEINIGLYETYDKVRVFKSNYKGIVLVKDIHAYGVCPHHLMPIEYKISFAYIPTDYVVGLSKIPRVIKNLAARPVLQEDLTDDIIDYFQKKLHPLGMAVIIEGIHGCMKFRGIKEVKPIKTSRLEGSFMKEVDCRNELYELIR